MLELGANEEYGIYMLMEYDTRFFRHVLLEFFNEEEGEVFYKEGHPEFYYESMIVTDPDTDRNIRIVEVHPFGEKAESFGYALYY